MCPSYMVTLEEQHSTRGRAHLMFEMLQGEVLKDGWQSEEVKQALDLCLSCKACKTECPTNVDLATYRSEFLAHYYEQRQRPLEAYAFGLIDKWAALGSKTPRLANILMRAPGITPLVKRVLHLAPRREMPRLATQSFARWARSTRVPARTTERRQAASGVWADTFNNYFPHNQSCRSRGLRSADCMSRFLRAAVLWPTALRFRHARPREGYLQRVIITWPQIDAGSR